MAQPSGNRVMRHHWFHVSYGNKNNTFALNVCGLESLNDREHIFAEIHVEFLCRICQETVALHAFP